MLDKMEQHQVHGKVPAEKNIDQAIGKKNKRIQNKALNVEQSTDNIRILGRGRCGSRCK